MWNWVQNTIPRGRNFEKSQNDLDPDLLKRMRDFYSTRKAGGTDEDQLAKYISLAVVLDDPPIQAHREEENLPDDARSVLGFVPLLQEFYQKAGVSRLWAEVVSRIRRRDGPPGTADSDAIARRRDAYLRVVSGGSSTQTLRITCRTGGAPE